MRQVDHTLDHTIIHEKSGILDIFTLLLKMLTPSCMLTKSTINPGND
jgi:hypothetical protein